MLKNITKIERRLQEDKKKMYKVIMMDNYLDTKKLNIYEKTYETLEEAEEAYSEIFRLAKG